MSIRIPLTLMAVLAVSAANASLVFDTVTGGGPSYSTSTPNAYMGDIFNLPALSAGQFYRINSIRVGLIQKVTTAVPNVVLNVRAYATATGAISGTDPVYSNLKSNVNWTVGNLSTQTGVVYYNLNLDYAAAGLKFDLPTGGTTLGLVLGALEGTAPSSNLSWGLVTRPSVVAGSSSPGFYYRNVSNTGTIIGSDARNIGADSNLWVQVDAQAVPEPGTMAVLGLGILALKRRRRSTR